MVDKNLLDQLLKEADKLTIELEIERAKKDPYFFLTRFCYTIDEHDPSSPYKTFPKKEYIRDLCDLFVSENLLVVEKSRQMMVSWIFCALILWWAMLHRPEGNRVFIMSKKEKDADALIERIKRMYEKLPEKMIEGNKADPFTYLKMQWSKRNTIIQGVAQGPDQVRSYTSSLVFMDEMSFQEKAEKVYESVKPSLAGGGKFIGVSTPNGKEFFYRCVKDKFNA